jgi:hypothetical protein
LCRIVWEAVVSPALDATATATLTTGTTACCAFAQSARTAPPRECAWVCPRDGDKSRLLVLRGDIEPRSRPRHDRIGQSTVIHCCSLTFRRWCSTMNKLAGRWQESSMRIRVRHERRIDPGARPRKPSPTSILALGGFLNGSPHIVLSAS